MTYINATRELCSEEFGKIIVRELPLPEGYAEYDGQRIEVKDMDLD